jgi:hypothetical protein
MTPEERDRLTKLETIVEGMRVEQAAAEKENDTRFKAIDAKLDVLIATMNTGKGAWKAVALMGTVILALVSLGAWVYDHLPAITHAAQSQLSEPKP